MIRIRPARSADEGAVVSILKEVDIYYSALKFKDFWVAEENGAVIGCAQLEEYPDLLYLGSVAVTGTYSGKGVAKKLLERLLVPAKKDTYIYTIIPDFFKKFGFVVTAPRTNLPSKERYECEDCHSDRCVCMVRRPK